jgi:ABC-2 type transport system permease protein
MGDGGRALVASARLEFQQLNRSRALVALAALEAITFLVLVSLFGLTGSRAPTAIVDEDHGPLAASFVRHLDAAHHSFALRHMSAADARSQLHDGNIVAIITIPHGFSSDVASGHTVMLPVVVDNVDTDLTNDIKEALPSAIVAFGKTHGFGGIRVVAAEHDLVDHETGYIPYLVVSALVLDALVVAGILGAFAITREYEARTVDQWRLAPVRSGWVLAGKLLAAAVVSAGAVAIALAIVVLGYGVGARDLSAAIAGLGLCVVIFTAIGAAVGALLRRTLPVAALFFGLALPFYIDSGALEPVRFDGNTLWKIGHSSPVYNGVAILESAFHGLRVTPESLGQNLVVLTLWAVAAVLVSCAVLARRVVRR